MFAIRNQANPYWSLSLPADTPVSGHDGDVIRRARRRMVPKMSIAKAAALTGDDAGNWGHTERGYQDLGGDRGRRVIMHPPPDTLARMSSVVGVTPAQWQARGREDVAALLGEILEERRREAEAVSAASSAADDAFLRVIRASPDLTREQVDEYTRMWLQGGREEVAKIAARMRRRPGGS
jgi:hypothetical protein